MKKITTLTAGQVERFADYRERWLAHGLSTAAAERGKAEEAIANAYRCAGLAAPTVFAWLDSPLRGAIGAAMLAQVGDQVRAQVGDQVGAQVGDQVGAQVGDQVGAQVWAQVRAQVGAQVRAQVRDQVRAQVRAQVWDQVWAQVRAQVRDQVRAQVRAQVWDACYGQHDASWLAFYEFFGRECGLECCEKLRGMQTAAQHCGWWWPFANAVIITERPRTLVHDAEGRLHREDGPALQYPDGWGIWAWHGVRVPQDVIERPETITVEQIEHERNAEVRRVLITRYGQDRYLRDSGAQQLHRDDWGALWRKELAGDEPLVMVQVTNSTAEPDGTYKDYFLRVQPELRPLRDDGLGEPQELTALNAVASTFGMTGREYCRELAAQS